MGNEYRSRVYTKAPSYADLDSSAKFLAIQGIIAWHSEEQKKQVGNNYCSVCHIYEPDWCKYRFCPHCGARMDGEAK